MTRHFSDGVVALSLLAVLTVAGSSAPSALRLGDDGFRAFLPRFEAGLHRFVNGDPGPWNEHVSRSANGSILGGFGGFELGTDVGARYTWAASQFEESGATVQIQYLSTVVDGDLAYTVSIERSRVRIRGKTVPMALRVTHAFRRESGQWKLLHPQADWNVTRAAP